MSWLLPLLVIAILCVGIVLVSMRRRRLKVPLHMKGVIKAQWQHVGSIQDAEKRLMEAEKVVYQAFRSMGLEGSFGDILKKNGPRIKDLNAVWEAHKLRNRLAHEPGFHPPVKDLERAIRVFDRTLHLFL